MMLSSLGYELEDVLRVMVGIVLGLLTVYRRELSCNRGYHPDENDDPLVDSIHSRLLQRRHSSSIDETDGCDGDNDDLPTGNIRRRKSSSSLPSMIASPPDENNASPSAADRNKYDDPTENLLDSVGLSLSGGPFLAAAIAVFDHLVLTSFLSVLGVFASVRSLLGAFRAKIDVQNRPMTPQQGDASPQQFLPDTGHDRNDEAKQQQYVYSVAWNAATEYYTNISSKLDNPPSPSGLGEQRRNSNGKFSRSKSTGNLQHLSDKKSRALLRDMVAMANRGAMDVTLLPSDAQIGIFSYLPPQDVLAFTCTNRAGRNLLEEGDTKTLPPAGEDNIEDDSFVDFHGENGDTALLIWKAMFQRDYSWVLSDWEIGKEAFDRSIRDGQGLQQQQHQQHNSNSRTIFQHLTSIILGTEHDSSDHLRASIGSMHPTSSMKDFYFTFTETWLNYTIAGCNTDEKCLIGLHGHVFDISNFVEDHPGSTETLLLQAGRDATVFFESMGHSLNARKLAIGMVAVVNGQCARINFTGAEGSNPYMQLRAGALGPLFNTWGLIKPWDRSLDIKRKIVGFLIPRKRSRPRFQGGLHRIRERIAREEQMQLAHAARWTSEILGPNGLFGGVHPYFDPFRGWRWWYTDRDLCVVYMTPPN